MKQVRQRRGASAGQILRWNSVQQFSKQSTVAVVIVKITCYITIWKAKIEMMGKARMAPFATRKSKRLLLPLLL
jgi:hypothetical protein